MEKASRSKMEHVLKSSKDVGNAFAPAPIGHFNFHGLLVWITFILFSKPCQIADNSFNLCLRGGEIGDLFWLPSLLRADRTLRLQVLECRTFQAESDFSTFWLIAIGKSCC